MSSVEEEVAAAFDKREPDRLADLGGVSFLQGREREVARVTLMPEILSLVLSEFRGAPLDGPLTTFVVACAEVPVGADGVAPSAFKDAMEALAHADLGDDLADQCQDVVTRRAANPSEHEVARWSALGAAMQIAVSRPALRFALLHALLRLKGCEAHPEFARRAAKVVGVAHAHWPDTLLLGALERLSAIPLARDEAMFELGMAKLRQGIDADSPRLADACFEDARAAFGQSLAAREHRPDAAAYAGALAMLTALRRGDPPEALRSLAAEVSRELAVMDAWATPERPTWEWLGARWTELLRWRELVGRIADLAVEASAACAEGAELDVRRRLLGTYVANRVVLGRGAGGVETFIQPAVEARVLRDEFGAVVIEDWLAEVAASDGEWREAAASLLRAIRTGGVPPGKRSGTAAHQA
jgi:hypothetical protein